jgi:hypothetical protein
MLYWFPAGICGQWTAALGDIWILKDAMQNNPVPLSSEPRVLDASGGTIPVQCSVMVIRNSGLFKTMCVLISLFSWKNF